MSTLPEISPDGQPSTRGFCVPDRTCGACGKPLPDDRIATCDVKCYRIFVAGFPIEHQAHVAQARSKSGRYGDAAP